MFSSSLLVNSSIFSNSSLLLIIIFCPWSLKSCKIFKIFVFLIWSQHFLNVFYNSQSLILVSNFSHFQRANSNILIVVLTNFSVSTSIPRCRHLVKRYFKFFIYVLAVYLMTVSQFSASKICLSQSFHKCVVKRNCKIVFIDVNSGYTFKLCFNFFHNYY